MYPEKPWYDNDTDKNERRRKMTAFDIDVYGERLSYRTVRTWDHAVFYLLGEKTVIGGDGEKRPTYYIFCAIDDDEGGECETVFDVAPSRERAEAMFEAIVRGGVTPCTLRDVTDDLKY